MASGYELQWVKILFVKYRPLATIVDRQPYLDPGLHRQKMHCVQLGVYMLSIAMDALVDTVPSTLLAL